MIFAANFKMNHTRVSTWNYLHNLWERLVEHSGAHQVYVFPPASALHPPHSPIIVGAQNAYPQMQGAFTGEIGMEQLDEFGINTLLIGHSERRTLLGESQETVAQKYTFFKERNYEIFYCIGEPISVREAGDEAVEAYLLAQLDGIDIHYDRLVVAYEPIWAIGTGRTATPEQAVEVHKLIRAVVKKKFNGEVADVLRIQYGGSVKPDNAKTLLSEPEIDGALVGGASLKADSFEAIVRAGELFS